MPRSLVLGNGSLLVCFDEYLQMRDFYYPYVGEEDHTTYGKFHRLGFFVEGRGLSWTNDGSWKVAPGYMASSLVSSSTLVSERLGLSITSEDFVDPTHDVLIRSFKLQTTDGAARTVRCFFHHDFYLYGDKQKDTAFYEPHTKTVIHYRQQRYFLVGGTTSDPVQCGVNQAAGEFHPLSTGESAIEHCGVSSFAIGKSNYRGLEGTWRDAEDGILSRYPIEQGSVDSTVEIDCLVRPDRETSVHLWVCAGQNIRAVHDLQHFILEDTPEQIKQSARNYWRGWVRAHTAPSPEVSEELQEFYWRSLLILRTQIDNHGGIIAANDNDIMQFNRDTYTYVWPRDGAFATIALTRAGQGEVVDRFFRFCARAQTHQGYLLHKYNPDGSAGSSWHPWFADEQTVLPIQCDETALPLLAMWRHFERFQDFEFLHAIYQTFVKKAADFLVSYRERETGLPLPSYDLWEERRCVATFTVAATCAGLRAAANIATSLGHYRHAGRYAEIADDMCSALVFHLYDEEGRSFLKSITREGGQTTERDATPDASIAHIWTFGILPPDDPRVVSTIQRLERELAVRTPVGGIARYRRDVYQSVVPPGPDVPGNPWIITTLWIAQWKIATARTLGDLQGPLRTLEWVRAHATSSGILPEQLHPYTGQALSVAPLTWSHATFIETLLMYGEKLSALKKRS